MAYYISFVVRIRESESDNIVRGHIQHVSTQEGQYFSDVENMVQFIMSHLNPPTNKCTQEHEVDEGFQDGIVPFDPTFEAKNQDF